MRYSIGAIVSDWAQYDAMQKSFFDAGFSQETCQHIAINNVGKNRFCMYSGGNTILQQSIGDYVILAHQDIRLLRDNRKVLDERLEYLENVDPLWAVSGNAGEVNGEWIVRISDKYGKDQKTEKEFPCKVTILDGNLLIIKRNTFVSFSQNLHGFHYYGWDLCVQAETLGYTSYVIDYHVEHLGKGDADGHFYECKDAFEKKWAHAIRSRKLGAFQHDQVTLI